jgi:hypothetical protein
MFAQELILVRSCRAKEEYVLTFLLHYGCVLDIQRVSKSLDAVLEEVLQFVCMGSTPDR